MIWRRTNHHRWRTNKWDRWDRRVEIYIGIVQMIRGNWNSKMWIDNRGEPQLLGKLEY